MRRTEMNHRQAIPLRCLSGRNTAYEKQHFRSKMLAAAMTAKKRFSPHAYTHYPEDVEGQGVTLLCDFSLFLRPPPGCEK